MTLREQLTDDEWNDLVQAPTLVVTGFFGVSPQGVIGMAKETRAYADQVAKLTDAEAGPRSGVLAEVATVYKAQLAKQEVEAPLPDESKYEGVPPRDIVMGAVGRAKAALAKLTLEETSEYRVWLYELAREIAAAAREGGRFFKRGSSVSDEEQALLDEIRATLDVPETT